MRAFALFAMVLGAASAVAGLALAFVAFAPIPFADSIDFFGQFVNAGGWGGWGGFGFEQLYVRHNEHRLVVPRLWFLLDMVAFDATQAFLIVVTVLSSLIHAAILALLFRALGHRGWVLWGFAGAAAGAVLSPAQWENLVWGFQVQFIQVWLFATLAFVAIAGAQGRDRWWLVLAGVLAALASTYSMANGLLVWPLLVALALWCGVRGGPLALLVVAAVAVVGIEALGFHAHPGHGDPMKTIADPGQLLLYAFRYLTNGIGAIGTRGQEIIGALLSLTVVAISVDAILRRSRYSPTHAALLAIAGFIIGAALATALGRVTFGLGQANATRYATPSFIFLLTTGALLFDRLLRLQGRRLKLGAMAVGVALLLVPGLVDGIRHVPVALAERDARINAVVTYIAGGYRPGELVALYPFLPSRPYRTLQRLDAEGWGPFATRDRFMPPPALLRADAELPAEACRGHVDSAVSDPVDGVAVSGWAAAAVSAEQPQWIVVTDRTGRVVGWGASRVPREDVGAALGIGWRGRGFEAVGPAAADGPLAVTAAFGDGRRCVLATAVMPTAVFLATLPTTARPATAAAWTVVEGTGTGRTGPAPLPAEVGPAIGTLGDNSHLVAMIDLRAPEEAAALAVPLRTGAFPIATVMLVRDRESGEVIASHQFDRPSDHDWAWRVFAGTADSRFAGRMLRVEVATAGPGPALGIAVGRPHWLPAAQ